MCDLKNVPALINSAVILSNFAIDFNEDEEAIIGEEHSSVLEHVSDGDRNMVGINEDFFWRNKIVSEVFQ